MIEALYFHTYYSFLKGNLEKTRMFFEMLRDEFRKRRDPEALSKKQLDELRSIRESIKTGKIYTSQWVPQDTPDVVDKPPSGIYQDALVRRIYFEALDSMRDLLGSNTSLKLYNIEHPCGEYGSVDMVFSDDRVIYPVEIKRTEGKHDIIGQIMKYALHFRFRLHYKLYEDVQPVTICNSYNPQVLGELKRLGVLALKYTLVEDNVKLRAV